MTNETLTSGTLTATAARMRANFPGSGDLSLIGSLAYVFLGGRRIWTFRIDEEKWAPATNTLEVEWPAALLPHLSGVATVRFEAYAGPNHPASQPAIWHRTYWILVVKEASFSSSIHSRATIWSSTPRTGWRNPLNQLTRKCRGRCFSRLTV